MAKGFEFPGIAKGNRVAIMLPNCPEYGKF